MDPTGKKWIREAKELFEFFQSEHLRIRNEPTNEVLASVYAIRVKEAREYLDLSDLKELVTFGITHWEQIRDYDFDGRNLDKTPSLYQMFAGWRYPRWLKLNRDGVFKVQKAQSDEEIMKEMGWKTIGS
jgi:hypothetical protein